MIAFKRGANYRALVLLYLTCVLLSLASSVVGPPERNFNQGQPELQQAMDNMVLHDELVKKSHPLVADTKVSPMFSNRATALLDEAQSMLSLAKGIREKAWLKNFIHKLKMLASILEQNIANTTPLALNVSTAPDDDLLKQNLSQTVPQTGPGQMNSNQVTSTLPLTLPETNQAKSAAEHATVDHVTKPGIIPPLTEEIRDELVEELESLHKLSSLEPFDRSVIARETSSKSVELITLPSLIVEGNVEQEKEKLRERIVNEVAELKKLGETDENILNAIHTEGFKLAESKPLKARKQQISNEHATMKRVSGENSSHNWNIPRNHILEPPRQIYMNNTFVDMNINLPLQNPRVMRRQFHYGYHGNTVMNNFPAYPRSLKGTIQKLQNQGSQNFLARNHMHGAPNFLHQGNPIQQQRARGRNHYGAAHSETRSMKVDPLFNPYVNPNTRPLYMPYPVKQNMEQKNKVNVTSTAYTMNKEPAEFTEEMKRQLRDGKVILISDSVVSSNYTSDEKKEKHSFDESKTKKKLF